MTIFRGILPALVTPLDADGRFDESSCRRVASWALRHGVHGLLALGSTGEMAALDAQTRERVVEVVVDAAEGRAFVMVGIAQTALADAVVALKRLAGRGAAAALVAPPFYGPVDAQGVKSFYRALRETSPIPLFAYNIPAFTKVTLSPDIVGELAEEKTIVGLKDSGRDFEFFQQIVDRTRGIPDFALFTGADALLLPSLLVGGAGGITACANLVPQVLVRIYAAALERRWADAVADQAELSRLAVVLRVGTFPAGIKAALSFLGLCGATTAPPSESLTALQSRRLRDELSRLGILAEDVVGDRGDQPLIPPAAMPRTS